MTIFKESIFLWMANLFQTSESMLFSSLKGIACISIHFVGMSRVKNRQCLSYSSSVTILVMLQSLISSVSNKHCSELSKNF